MSDDIVTRLREAHQKVVPDWLCNDLRFRACYEIERLRAEVKQLEKREYCTSCDCHYCVAQWAAKEYGVRGD